MSDLVKVEPNALPPAPYQELPPTFDPGAEGDLSFFVKRARQFVYQVLLKHKWTILAITLVVVALAAVQNSTTTPTYRSWVKIQIEPESAGVLPFRQVTDSAFSGSEEYLNAQVSILRSRTLALRVIEHQNLPDDAPFNAPRSDGILGEYYNRGLNWLLGLLPRSRPAPKAPAPAAPPAAAAPAPAPTQPAQPPRRVQSLVGRFAGDLAADVIKGTRMVEVSYVSVDPVEAARLVEAIVNEYVGMNFEAKVSTTTAASTYLTLKQQEQKAAIEKSEQALGAYARANGIMDFEGRDDIALQTLNALNGQLSTAEGKVNAAKAGYDLVKSATPENFPQSLINPVIADVHRRISGLQQQLATLTPRYGSKWPDVLKANEEIAQLEVQLRAERIKAIEDATDRFETVLREQRNVLATVDGQKRVAERLNEKLIQYRILKREVESNRKIFDELMAQTKQTGISATLKPDNIRVIDRIGVPGGPFRPRTSYNLTMGLLMGLFLGVGLAGLLVVLDNTVKTPEELEMNLGLPSLGIVPTLRQLKPVTPAAADGEVAVPDLEPRDGAVIPHHNLLSRAWEPYRALRTAILMSHSDAPPRVILLSSAVPGDGKTVTSVNLGIVLAKTGARTLLMDLDMRKPRMSEMFGASKQRGMSVYLSGNSEQVSDIVQTAVPNLFLVSSGKVPPNSAELVGSRRMREAIAAMRQEFDYIIIDSPPILPCTDAVVLSRQVDGVVLVVRGGHTPKKAIEDAAVRLTNVGAKILGVVMNDIDLAKPEYAYYYGSYSQHYHHYYGKDNKT